ncbi:MULTISPECIES: autotransporter domain-containing protein [unclassified Anaerobiospirillum]|uniref:autotransporter domain-containing protein n=1 Tax=unclassified Anaerobiospirillum TaxID=2647410 RepID=UPI001FF3A2F9|nr:MULTISPECIES: autotransporter domain-containing protein [unclassified Anaerobiospirillum]MCK0535501.1 autotransporter domain-containing protein [Anaerobiospirillum sp. NML120511]MCK0540697.1 autotransporter domain-containing protein [Anaerobiospirillum sp. NML02-A-032]
MKLSNNAIKFLMAQYRAIYKNAYFKGIASAVVLTAGLAAGQAQAAPTELKSNFTSLEDASGDLYIKSTISGNGTLKPWNAKLSSSGSNSGAFQASGGALSFTGDGSLVLDANKTTAFSFSASGSGSISASIGLIDISKGALKIIGDGKSGTATVSAKTINIKSEVSGGASVTIGDATKSGAASLGSNNSTINLGPSGSITLNGSGAATAKVIGNLVATGGAIKVSGSGGTIGTWGKDATVDITIASGAGMNAVLELKDDEATADVDEGTLGIASGTITVTGAQSDAAKLSIKGNLSLGEGVSITSKSSGSGSIVVGSGANGTLSLYKKTLDGYLGEKGQLDLKGSGSLVFVTADSTAVDLGGTEIVNAAADGKLSAASGAKIKSENVLVSAPLSGNGSGNVVIVANKTLTLGSSSFDNAGGKLGFSSAEAPNVEFVNKTGESVYTLQDKLTLTSVSADGTTAQDGSITGAVNVSGSITVKGGNITNSGDITVSGGSITVDGSGSADSVLKASGNLTLADAAGTKLVASGAKATLDLTGATVAKATGTSKLPVIEANAGIVKIKASDAQAMLDTVTASASGTQFKVSGGGSLIVSGELSLDKSKIGGSGMDKGGILLTKGTLSADGLAVSGLASGAALDIGASGSISVGTLTLENEKDGAYNDVYVGSGNYTVLEALETTQAVGLHLASGSTMTLGGTNHIDGGSIAFNKINLASGSTFNVSVGPWGSVATSVALADGAKFKIDTNGAFTAKDMTVANGGLTVGTDASLNLTTYTQTSGDITVNGAMTVAGKEDITPGLDGADDTVNGYGLKIAGKVDVAGPNASFTIGSEALKALADERFVTDASGTISVAYKTDASGNAFDITSGDAAQFSMTKFGTLKLQFTEADTFTLDQLKALRKEFTKSEKALGDGFISLGNAKIDGVSVTDGKITAETLGQFSDFTDFVMADLATATVTGANASNTINGNVGNIEAQAGNQKVNVGVATLNDCKGKGFAYAEDTGKLVTIAVKAGGTLGLNNGGNAGSVTLSNSSADIGRDTILLVSGGNTATNIAKVDGKGDMTKLEVGSGVVNVAEGVKAGTVLTHDNTELNITAGGLNLTAATGGSVFGGNVNVAAGETNVSGTALLMGASNSFADNADIGTLELQNGSSTFGKSVTSDDVKVQSGASLVVKGALSLKGGDALLAVGADDIVQDGKVVVPGSTGYLQTAALNLSGGTLLVDPEYGQNTSVAAVDYFGTAVRAADVKDAGTVNGTVVLGKNAALMAGAGATVEKMQNFISAYQNNGSLVKGDTANALYINGKMTLASGGQIVLDGQNSSEYIQSEIAKAENGAYSNAYGAASGTDVADLYMGNGAILAVSDQALKDGAAVHFELASGDTTANIYAPRAASKDVKQGKIVLDGDGFLNTRTFNLFTASTTGANPTAGTVMVLGEAGKDDIRVETLNGLMYFDLAAGSAVTEQTLRLDLTKTSGAYQAASVPMKEFLVGYAAQTRNWQQAYSTDPDTGAAVAERVELLGNVVADQSLFTVDPKTGALTFSATAPQEFQSENPITGFTAVDGVVYSKASNAFLEKVARNTSGLAADQAARMGVFGGAPQAALTATSTTSDAVAGLFGMGNAAAALTYADNGQGTGMWVTPVYRSADSDGFGADGLEYGADVSLFGVALGGDYSLGNGMRVGAMLNIGSGDADGQGAASAVTNDFNYFGGALYAGYSMDALSIVADLSYTTVDSDVEANTEAGQVSSSFDTTTLSAGVTGQYAMNFGGVDVAPHAGLRFTRIDMDDYVITSAEFGDVGNFATSSANVFSIPVGVTISKEYAMDNWSVKPAFDLTLTGNFCDDTADGTVTWTNVTNWDVATKNEFVDSFTYGASMGVAAKSGNMGLGFGLNYTGSSNVKEFGANANVRYVF